VNLNHPVLVALKELVDENPGRRNVMGPGESCVYVLPSGQPACIIGVLAERLDWRLPEYESYENGQWPIEVWPEIGSDDLEWFLADVQVAADSGDDWGQAFECALAGLG